MRDRRHADGRAGGELLLQRVVLGLALGQAQPPAVVVDHDRDVVGVVERRRGAVEGRVVEVPLRRGDLPDQLVRSRAGSSRSPPGRARSRSRTGTTIRTRPSAAAASCLRPGCRSDSRSPTTTALQRSGHSAAMMSAVRAPQSNPPMTAFWIFSASISAMMSRATTDCCPLRERVGGEEARRAVTAQIRNDHAVALGRQQRRDVDDSCGCHRASRAAGPPASRSSVQTRRSRRSEAWCRPA